MELSLTVTVAKHWDKLKRWTGDLPSPLSTSSRMWKIKKKKKIAHTLRAVVCAELGAGVQHLTNASIWPENLPLSFGWRLGLCSVSRVGAAL